MLVAHIGLILTKIYVSYFFMWGPPVHNPSPLRSPNSHPSFEIQRSATDDQAEAQARHIYKSNSSDLPLRLCTLFVVGVLVASLLALHLCLEDPAFFVFFDKKYHSTILYTPDIIFEDSWISTTTTHHDTDFLQLEYKIIPPSNNQNPSTMWTFLLLHGLGDYKASASFRIREALINLRPDLFESMRFIMPTAGQLPITVFGDQIRSAWFDIKNWTNVHQQEDVHHMKQNVNALLHILQNNQIDLSRTIIGGFSQGAVMSLLLSLCLSKPPAAVIMLSGYTPIPAELLKLRLPVSKGKENNWKTGLHWLHGELDPYFKIQFANEGFNILKNLNYFSNSSFNSIVGLDHNWSIIELNILAKILERSLAP